MIIRNQTASAALALALAAMAQPALAQTIACDQLKQLQQSGQDKFSGIEGAATYPGSAQTSFTLAGAERCWLDNLDTDNPSYKCVWSGYAGQGAAESARLGLKNQILACLPAGYKTRDRQSNLSGSSNFTTRITFNAFQPKIIVARRYSKAARRFTVEFSFEMDLPRD